MTAVAGVLDREYMFIAADTLCVNLGAGDSEPERTHQLKLIHLPHLRLVVGFKGSQAVHQYWVQALKDGAHQNFDAASEAAPVALTELLEGVQAAAKREGLDDEVVRKLGVTTIYHCGIQDGRCEARRFRASEGFKTEVMNRTLLCASESGEAMAQAWEAQRQTADGLTDQAIVDFLAKHIRIYKKEQEALTDGIRIGGESLTWRISTEGFVLLPPVNLEDE